MATCVSTFDLFIWSWFFVKPMYTVLRHSPPVDTTKRRWPSAPRADCPTIHWPCRNIWALKIFAKRQGQFSIEQCSFTLVVDDFWGVYTIIQEKNGSFFYHPRKNGKFFFNHPKKIGEFFIIQKWGESLLTNHFFNVAPTRSWPWHGDQHMTRRVWQTPKIFECLVEEGPLVNFDSYRKWAIYMWFTYEHGDIP